MTGSEFDRRGVLAWLGAMGLAVATTPASANAKAKEKLAVIEPRVPAPDFTLEDLDGKSHTLSDYRGQVVLLTFWATWCPPCRFEIPSLQRAWQSTKAEGIVTLAVHVGGDVDKVMLFAMDYGAEFPILVDRESRVVNDWPVKALPASIIIDPAGEMALKAVGSREWDDPDLITRIRALKT